MNKDDERVKLYQSEHSRTHEAIHLEVDIIAEHKVRCTK